MSRLKENSTSSFWKGRENTCLVPPRHNLKCFTWVLKQKQGLSALPRALGRQNILFYAARPKWNDWGIYVSLCTLYKFRNWSWRHLPISQIPHFIGKMENLLNVLMDLLREWRPLILTKQLCITSGILAALWNELKINYIQWYAICYQNITVSFSCKTPISYLVITAFLAVIRLN